MEPEFVTGEAAVLLGEKLIVSDLHIGIEHEYYKSGIKMESQTHVMKTRLDSIIKISKPKELIFLGDIKHKVPGISYQEVKEIPEFINHFSKEIKVTVVMGNHDPGIENLGIKFHVKPTEGYASDDVYLTHGHTWPDKGFLGCRYIVMGHIQPQIEFKDKLGYVWREPVWVRTRISPAKLKSRYGKVKNLPELIIIPAFNTFIGGMILNKKGIVKERKEYNGPLLKCADMKKSDIYLLDGTFLGKLKDL